jgi:putative phosphoribosyl transferase
MNETFRDRSEAGQRLAEELIRRGYAKQPGLLILGLPRGGVPVAFEVARALRAPMDVFLVRKLGVPGYQELAMGAIASGGIQVRNEPVIRRLRIPEEAIAASAAIERDELHRREMAYRGSAPMPALRGRTIILVDDGIATGSTMRAAIAALRGQHPARLTVAVPVAAAATCDQLRPDVDALVALIEAEDFYSVGQWYEHFPQTTDAEVADLLARAGRITSHAPGERETLAEDVRTGSRGLAGDPDQKAGRGWREPCSSKK